MSNLEVRVGRIYLNAVGEDAIIIMSKDTTPMRIAGTEYILPYNYTSMYSPHVYSASGKAYYQPNTRIDELVPYPDHDLVEQA